DVIRGHVEGATELSLLRKQKLETEAKIADCQKGLASLLCQRELLVAEWRALWPAELFVPRPPAEMREWLSNRSAVLASADALAEEGVAIDDLVTRDRQARESLSSALMNVVGVFAEERLDELIQRARNVLERITRENTAYVTAQESVRARQEHKEQTQSAL